MAVDYTPLSNSRVTPAGDQDWEKARQLVDAQYNPQRNEMLRQIDQMMRDRNQQVTTQQEYGRIGDERLAGIYDTLGGQLEQGVGRTRGLYDAAEYQVGNYYDDATNETQSATDRLIQQMQSDAQRLGIEEATYDPVNDYRGTLLKAISRNASSRAGAVGNVAAMGTDMEALAQGRVADARRTGAGARAELQNNVQRGVLEAQQQAGEGLYSAYGRLGDVESVRGDALRAAYDDVYNARTERERQEKLDALAEEIQRNTMRLQEAQFGLGAQGQMFEQNMALQDNARQDLATATEYNRSSVARRSTPPSRSRSTSTAGGATLRRSGTGTTVRTGGSTSGSKGYSRRR